MPQLRVQPLDDRALDFHASKNGTHFQPTKQTIGNTKHGIATSIAEAFQAADEENLHRPSAHQSGEFAEEWLQAKE